MSKKTKTPLVGEQHVTAGCHTKTIDLPEIDWRKFEAEQAAERRQAEPQQAPGEYAKLEIRIPRELKEKLRQEAKRTDMTMAQLATYGLDAILRFCETSRRRW